MFGFITQNGGEFVKDICLMHGGPLTSGTLEQISSVTNDGCIRQF